MKLRFADLCTLARVVRGLALAVAVAMASALASPSPALAASSQQLPPDPLSRTVEIDGRFYTVELSLIRTIPGAPGPSNKPTTTATVDISIQDGGLLPTGLRAASIRFEKLRGTNRVFRAPLQEVPTTLQGFELSARSYRADISGKSRGVQRLKAVVRLEIDGRVITVPFGTVPIHLEPLP